MHKLKNLLWVGALLFALSPLRASAAPSTFTMNSTGWAFIGVIAGATWAGVSNDAGFSCSQWLLLSSNTALKNDWIVQGSGGADFIWAVDQSTFFCGFSVAPLNADGHSLQIFGNGGSDILNGGNQATAMSGGSGNDSLEGRRFNFTADGASGTDQLFSREGSATLSGGTGDDVVCATNPSTRLVLNMTGNGNDTSNPGDRRCGMGSSVTTGFETTGCQSPCF